MKRARAVLALGLSVVFLGMALEAGAATVRVRCVKRVSPARSKISVDGNNLAPGAYQARVTSPPGANAVTSPAAPADGDEAEFDFDSKPADVAEGATAIPGTYVQTVAGPDVRGEVLDAAGTVLASASVECRVK